MRRQGAENDHRTAGGRACTQRAIEREGGAGPGPLKDGLLFSGLWGPSPTLGGGIAALSMAGLPLGWSQILGTLSMNLAFAAATPHGEAGGAKEVQPAGLVSRADVQRHWQVQVQGPLANCSNLAKNKPLGKSIHPRPDAPGDTGEGWGAIPPHKTPSGCAFVGVSAPANDCFHEEASPTATEIGNHRLCDLKQVTPPVCVLPRTVGRGTPPAFGCWRNARNHLRADSVPRVRGSCSPMG